MDTVLRVAALYLFVLVVFRLSGKRSLGEMTTFDFVLLLVISETTQQAMVNDDHSLTNAFLLIVAWIGIDIGLSLLKHRFKLLDKILEGVPLVLVVDGKPIQKRLDRERIDVDDILAAARESQGLERLDQIKYAVLERSGGISIIPAQPR